MKRKIVKRLYMSWIWSVLVWASKHVTPEYDSTSRAVLHYLLAFYIK